MLEISSGCWINCETAAGIFPRQRAIWAVHAFRKVWIRRISFYPCCSECTKKESDFINMTVFRIWTWPENRSCVCLNLLLHYSLSVPFLFLVLFFLSWGWTTSRLCWWQCEPGFCHFWGLDTVWMWAKSNFCTTRPVSWHGKHDCMIKVALEQV